jgi:hypothetical protein
MWNAAAEVGAIERAVPRNLTELAASSAGVEGADQGFVEGSFAVADGWVVKFVSL